MVLGDPEPVREEPRFKQFPETEKQPLVMLIPWAKVEVAVEVETMFPARKMLPWIDKAEPGEVVPMPTPVALTVSVGVAEKPTWKVLALLLVKLLPNAVEKSAEAVTPLPHANEPLPDDVTAP